MKDLSMNGVAADDALIDKMLLANPKMLGNKMNKTGIIIGVKI